MRRIDLANKVNTKIDTIHIIEHDKAKLLDIDYINFLLNNPKQRIIDARTKLNQTRQEFAYYTNTSLSSIRRWETGGSITKQKYERLKEFI
jgi:DNA-binding transcriptional regulator YiaG